MNEGKSGLTLQRKIPGLAVLAAVVGKSARNLTKTTFYHF